LSDAVRKRMLDLQRPSAFCFSGRVAPILGGMAAQSRLGQQVEEVAAALGEAGVPFALIGGLALAVHHVVRGTTDVDLLADSDSADAVDQVAAKLGYHARHRSPDVLNYLRGDQRLDILLAGRHISRQLLREARVFQTGFGALPVVSVEGIIGFKLQALANDPRRLQDMDDIRKLIAANKRSIDIARLKSYFELFDREQLLQELLDE
jgi:predicted nucleotidyltransferase